jgi:hypothetical protein
LFSWHVLVKKLNLFMALLANLVADNTTDSSATDGANGTSARQNGTAYGASTGADSRAFFLFRHPSARAHAENKDRYQQAIQWFG